MIYVSIILCGSIIIFSIVRFCCVMYDVIEFHNILASETVAIISFEEFGRMYKMHPDRFCLYDNQCSYTNGLEIGIGMATMKDLKKYKRFREIVKKRRVKESQEFNAKLLFSEFV